MIFFNSNLLKLKICLQLSFTCPPTQLLKRGQASLLPSSTNLDRGPCPSTVPFPGISLPQFIPKGKMTYYTMRYSETMRYSHYMMLSLLYDAINTGNNTQCKKQTTKLCLDSDM